MKSSLSQKAIITIAAIILSIVVTKNSNAQRITSFSENLAEFPVEMEKIIKSSLIKGEDELPKEFITFWGTDTLSTNQKNQIIRISNNILRKSGVNTRHFIAFIKILHLYKEQVKFQEEIDIWLKGLEDFSQSDKLSVAWISQFLDNTLALFTNGTFAINPAFSWKIGNKNFKYSFGETLTIKFSNTNLICTNKADSIAILSTSGTFYPTIDKWVGKGGKVTWVRSRFPENDIYATLNHYKVTTSKNEYEADSVLFTNSDYFKQPSLGRLKDKISRASNPDNAVYPEFFTYDQRHKITNLFMGVHFDGGYYMQGSQFVGKGTREKPAVIEIPYKNKEFLRVESSVYSFRRLTVISDNARIVFRIDKDSLYHTGLYFSYDDNSGVITISPTNMLTTQSPIQSTYHNFSLTFGQLQWKKGEDEMIFSAPIGSSQSRAIFESNNFFNENEFDNLMGRDEQHPLFAVANYTRSIKTKEFKVDEFARFIRKNNEQTRVHILRLAMLGYVLYDAESGVVRTLSKLYDAIRARGKFIDYDVLKFSSNVSSGANATLNLSSLEMAIRGVENVSISDSQNVFIYPSRKEIILKKNRSFVFDGIVRAGVFTIHGKKFSFNYEQFKINSNNIDSLNLDYQSKDIDYYGKKILKRVTSTLEVISGEIDIDKPNNKSGLEKNEEYPIFKSTSNAYVYYDDKTTFNGVYKRDKFYFKIDPFTFTGINNFDNKSLNFTGVFHSADIFAPIKDTLILRPDNSLGFRRVFPAEGYAVYKGKGRFYNRIDLSNVGLRGEGKIAYITTTTTADEIFFFPDSMSTKSKQFSIARQDAGITYPEVIGNEHRIKWYPYKDQLLVSKGKDPFLMFGNQTKLTGNIKVEPLGLIGDGLIDMGKAKLQSNKYEFNAFDFKTDLASISFNIVNKEDIGFASPQVKANINFNSQTGEFSKVGDRIFASINPLLYNAYLNGFIWEMGNNELTINTPSPLKANAIQNFYVSGMPKRDSLLSGTLFYSFHQDEDSLFFFSSKAKYNLNQPNIKADSVKSLRIADAIVYPYQQKVEVDIQKRMVPLIKSKIVANSIQKKHLVYDAGVKIVSRKKYLASGTINYVDENNTFFPLKLDKIEPDLQGNTYAQTNINEVDSFKLSPQIGFIGNVEIFAQNPLWLFNGGARPIHSCIQSRSSNVQFKSFIDPKNIFIPVSAQPQNVNQNYLISGSIVKVDSIHLYPGFLSGRKEYNDNILVKSEGYLHFNKSRGRFMIGSKEKILNPDTTGNLIGLSKELCMLFSEGQVDLPINLGQIKHSASGNLSHILADTTTLTLDLVLSLDFHFNEQSLAAMSADFIAQPVQSGSDLNRIVYKKYLNQKLGSQEAKKAINQISLFGKLTDYPKELQNTINFSDIKMRWDQKNTSFVSYGKIGVGSIGNVQINKKVDGFVELLKRNTGDWMMIYLQLSPEKYYVFYFVRGSLLVSSHDPLFTDPIKAMKAKDRTVKVKLGQIPYNFVVGTRRELQLAKERYNQLLGIKTETTEEEVVPEEKTETEEKGAEGNGL